jgi:hypothetical protein
LDAASIWTDPDKSRRIVWMIKQVIKRPMATSSHPIHNSSLS